MEKFVKYVFENSKEELELDVLCLDILTESIYVYPGGKIKLIAISAEIISGEIKLNVHDKFKWVKLQSLLDYQLAPADIPIAKWIIDDKSNSTT